MSISQISPNSLTSNSPHVNPYAKTTETQPAATQQADQDARKPVKATQTDTVTISQQALQKVNDDNASKAEEAKSRAEEARKEARAKQPRSFSAQA